MTIIDQKTKQDFSNRALVRKSMFKLLPLQILLALVSVTNDIISSLFASNAISADAMAAVGLYTPFSCLVLGAAILLVTGCQLLSSKYMGKHQVERTQGIFSLGIALSVVISAVLIVLHVIMAAPGVTALFTDDPTTQQNLSQFLLGKAIGVLPMILGMLLTAFLSIENQVKRTSFSGFVFIVANVVFHVIFVVVLNMGVFGLAFAAATSSCVFLATLLPFYITGKSILKFDLKSAHLKDIAPVLKTGSPESLSNVYFAIRAFILNAMISASIGVAGLSAYATVYTFTAVFWTLPDAMLVVSLMLIGVSVGEEDRQTLVDIMKVMLRAYVPITIAVALMMTLCAEPLTNLYYHDPSTPVYQLTLWGFRVYGWCLPLTVITMHFRCFGNAMGRTAFVHVLTILESLVVVPLLAAILIPFFGLNAVFAAYVLRGVVSMGYIVGYAWWKTGKFPTSVVGLMAMPDDFGVNPDCRMDLCVRSIDEVVDVSRQVRAFCGKMRVDPKRTLLSGLCLEEMAGNVVCHGFSADNRRHSVDIRVAYKEDGLILRIKDDCIPFDPVERAELLDPADRASHIGIRMVYDIATSIDYQHLLGLNVLTIRI